MTPKKIARDMLEAILYDNDMVNIDNPLDENKLHPWIVRVIKALEKPIEELGLDFFTEEWIEEFCCGDSDWMDEEVEKHPCLANTHRLLNEFFDEY